jgi:hypothetical protein
LRPNIVIVRVFIAFPAVWLLAGPLSSHLPSVAAI